ncbi:hypothetical protein ACI7YT_07605 [Microbacterium sp. M]|uniref:hypothetical protein n=1 Tax=Microbacterium sp. M TaxID=3377125 RepID=UPI003868942D
MRKRITFDEAASMLHTRAEVLATGVAERQLQLLVQAGVWKRVHRGQYVRGDEWSTLWPEGQQLVRVLAFARSSPARGPVFTHISAAVLWGLPLYMVLDAYVHILIAGVRHARRARGVMRHALIVGDDDIVEINGLLCTSLARTVFDLARTMSPEAAVSAGDAAQRQFAVTGHTLDTDRAEQWRDQLRTLTTSTARGVRKARWLAEFADGRAQLPGESVSRYRLHQLGFRDVELQVPVSGANGDEYFLDFGFRRSRKFGEFDGEGKYLEPELRSAPTAEDTVLAEKRREDDVRGVTGWGLGRWGHAHIDTAHTLGRRLAAFGILPPG